jgi:excisionase family DNA binding protein
MTDTLDTRGAAELLHVSESTVQALARSGEIPGTQLGGHWLFVRQDLLDTIRARAAEEQRARREQAAIIATLPRPNRTRGRPKKLGPSGQNSGQPP